MKQVSKEGIPILMYHGISAESPDPGAHRVHIAQQAFYEQMSWLYEEGYKTVSLTELNTMGAAGYAHLSKAFVLTFDDGFKSQLEIAAPILSPLGFRASSFIVTDWLYKPDIPTDLPVDMLSSDSLMDWEDVRKLLYHGWDIGSHTASHIDCTKVSPELLEHELQSSKAAILRELKVLPIAFAFPYGKYNAAAIQAVSQHYPMAFSVHDGHSQSARSRQHRQHRIEVNREDTLESFQRKILTGYGSRGQSFRAKIRDYVYESQILKDSITRWI